MSDIATQLIAAGVAPATPKPNGSAPDHEAVGWTLDDVMELAVDLGIKPMKFLQENKGLKPGQLMDKLDKIQKARDEKAALEAVPAASGPSVVAQVAANVGVSTSALQKELERLRAENEALKSSATRAVKFKMSLPGVNDKGQETKGGVMVISGTRGSFPINLFWQEVVLFFGDPSKPNDHGISAQIKAFALANKSLFRLKTAK